MADSALTNDGGGGRRNLIFRLLRRLVILLLAADVALVGMNATLRYVFGTAIIWSEDVAKLIFVWLIFIGSALAIAEGRHLKMVDRVPLISPRAGKWILTIAEAAALIMLLALIVHSIPLIRLTWHARMSTINMPVAAIYLAAPVGSFLMAIFLAIEIVARHGPQAEKGRELE